MVHLRNDKKFTIEPKPSQVDISRPEELAIRLHEIYKSYLAVEFTTEEDLSSIVKMTKN